MAATCFSGAVEGERKAAFIFESPLPLTEETKMSKEVAKKQPAPPPAAFAKGARLPMPRIHAIPATANPTTTQIGRKCSSATRFGYRSPVSQMVMSRMKKKRGDRT